VGVALGMFLLLTNWDVSGLGLAHFLQNELVVPMHGWISQTGLGTWKDGKLPAVLLENAGGIAELIIKVPLSACFLLMLPVIHDESRRKILHRLGLGRIA
jgi:hypothetical protein